MSDEVTPEQPSLAEQIAAGQRAIKLEQEQRAQAFHAEYLALCEKHACRHQPVAALKFDGTVQWQLVPVAFNREA